MNKGRALLIIAALQILLLAGMIGSKYYALHFGVPVLLKASPVDPWDPFRGEYVRLGYEISRVRGDIGGDLDPSAVARGRNTAYVALEREGDYWRAAGIYKSNPGAKEGRVVIKANSVNYDDSRSEYFLIYGIESFYVEEGEGKRLEQPAELDVLVRVDRFGRAVIESVTARNL